jgi:membrane protein implicated in regulation of membrane protease activity
MNPSILWLLAGAAMLAVEVFAIPTVVLLFAGLAAIGVGIVTGLGLIEEASFLLQWSWFFGLTVLFAILLWKPVKKFRAGAKGSEYNNIVGETAVVTGNGLHKSSKGQVQWSGTLMNAVLAADAKVDEVAAGTQVIINAINGNVLTVTPKH